MISVTVDLEYSLTVSASFPAFGLDGVYTLQAFQFVEIVPPTLFAPQWPLPWISWATQERTMTVASTEALVVFPELNVQLADVYDAA